VTRRARQCTARIPSVREFLREFLKMFEPFGALPLRGATAERGEERSGRRVDLGCTEKFAASGNFRRAANSLRAGNSEGISKKFPCVSVGDEIQGISATALPSRSRPVAMRVASWAKQMRR
jgi:hypothetical protein